MQSSFQSPSRALRVNFFCPFGLIIFSGKFPQTQQFKSSEEAALAHRKRPLSEDGCPASGCGSIAGSECGGRVADNKRRRTDSRANCRLEGLWVEEDVADRPSASRQSPIGYDEQARKRRRSCDVQADSRSMTKRCRLTQNFLSASSGGSLSLRTDQGPTIHVRSAPAAALLSAANSTDFVVIGDGTDCAQGGGGGGRSGCGAKAAPAAASIHAASAAAVSAAAGRVSAAYCGPTTRGRSAAAAPISDSRGLGVVCNGADGDGGGGGDGGGCCAEAAPAATSVPACSAVSASAAALTAAASAAGAASAAARVRSAYCGPTTRSRSAAAAQLSEAESKGLGVVGVGADGDGGGGGDSGISGAEAAPASAAASVPACSAVSASAAASVAAASAAGASAATAAAAAARVRAACCGPTTRSRSAAAEQLSEADDKGLGVVGDGSEGPSATLQLVRNT